jgi:hypothetical protein
MSGVAVIINLLQNNSNITAIIPSSRIMGGLLPIDIDLPAISVVMVDDFTRDRVEAGVSNVLIHERVQCTIEANTYKQQKDIIKLIRQSLPVSRGLVNGVRVDSVLYDSSGPDIEDPAMTAYIQSSDFIVKYTE